MSLESPSFKTEAEEADWWYEHREEVEVEFIVAAVEGRLIQSSRGDDHVVAPIDKSDAADLERSRRILRTRQQPIAEGTAQHDDLRRAS